MSNAAKSKGRGAVSNPQSRFAGSRRESFDDGWLRELDELPALETTTRPERAHSIISRNRSPDVPFEQSINPYRGCEHGCVYCFARPSHSYLDLSPGLDFETRLFHKENAVELLEQELRRPGYRCRPIVLGINTDAYQPIERELRLTRRLLMLLAEYRHPVSILTKGVTILRDLDLLADLASDNLVSVSVSLTTLDNDLKRTLEPRTASPAARLKILSEMRKIGIRPGVMVAPVIPAINDHEIEAILEAAAEAGAVRAGYVVLRLPHELKTLFRDWLQSHYPDRADHVMSLVRQLHGGRDYDPRFGRRQTGAGIFAQLLARRFEVSRRRRGLDQDRSPPLDTSRFRIPGRAGDQMRLFAG
ncbi:PA0069 family radical SAM protein [Wenzhouxiangella sp. EGI_FJ10409]|uniref:PA0069 family radical SAM protein n=1 Tax=Wenzhouxiangella sp. EGI_FJ10409 TaxID=3243767 RepID=UPI0035DD7DB7